MFDCATLDEFLGEYGPALGQATQDVMAPLHTPGKDPVDWLPKFDRQPFEPQRHVIAAGVKLLNRQKGMVLVGEMGTGKTLMGQAIAHAHASRRRPGRSARRTARSNGHVELGAAVPALYRALVMCPPQLCAKWARELKETIPGCRVYILETWADVYHLDPDVPPTCPTWFIIGRETAKLSSTWKPGVRRRGLELEGSKLQAKLKRKKRGQVRPGWAEAYLHRIEENSGWKGDERWGPGVYCPSCGQAQLDDNDVFVEPDQFGKRRQRCECIVHRPTPDNPEHKEACGEQLWQDWPEPRRYSPARYIKLKLRGYFDYFLVDEVHEMKGEGEVQAEALGSIATACKHVIALTGTLIGGYAWHVRTLLFRMGLGKAILDLGLGWKDGMAFSERFGRIETRIVEHSGRGGREVDKGGDVEEGHKTARGGKRRSVTKNIKPGIVPTLFGQLLVNSCVFLSLKEVSDQLPPYLEEVVPCQLDPDHACYYDDVAEALADELKEMLRRDDKRLLGTMLQVLLCYPDYPFGWSGVGYWDRGDFRRVCSPENLDPERVLPKERAFVRRIESELNEGRKVWAYSTFTDKRDCLLRLQTQLAAAGIKAQILRPTVDPKRREAWIASNGPRYDVILSHPELVKTGLDFFDKARTYNFPTIAFYGTGYNLFTLQQASRRSWRIGQGRECRVLYFYYAGTMQERAMKLMGQKATAAEALNGRFSAEGLTAMAGEDDNMEMAMARNLAERTKIEGGEGLRAWAKLTAELSTRSDAKDVEEGELEGAMARLAAMRARFTQPKLYQA